jgi:hypothetical protein
LRIGKRAYSASRLHGYIDGFADACDGGVILTLPEGTVEIDDVQPSRTGSRKIFRSLDGIAVVGRLLCGITVAQPDALSVAKIDGGDEKHTRSFDQGSVVPRRKGPLC